MYVVWRIDGVTVVLQLMALRPDPAFKEHMYIYIYIRVCVNIYIYIYIHIPPYICWAIYFAISMGRFGVMGKTKSPENPPARPARLKKDGETDASVGPSGQSAVQSKGVSWQGAIRARAHKGPLGALGPRMKPQAKSQQSLGPSGTAGAQGAHGYGPR